MRHLLVTGGFGFAMAHVVRQWLEADRANRAAVVDIAPPDAVAARFFGTLTGRIDAIVGDVRDPSLYARLPKGVDAVVAGAAVTPHAWRDAEGTLHEPEKEDPLAVIETNVMGLARLLDWWRRSPGQGVFVNLSSGSVYARDVDERAPGAMFVREDQHVGPDGLYDVTKLTGEQIARRFAALYGFPAVSLRLSGLFGPMDRYTSVRRVRCVPQIVAVNALRGRPTRVVSADTVGDWVAASDVARAVMMILGAPKGALRHHAYNIAAGRLATFGELARTLAPLTGGCELDEVPAEVAEIVQPPEQRTARWGAYDCARAKADFGWEARPLAETLAEYVDWLKAEMGV
ncbi:MAG: NAD-dependent epimerase/dehydratase family protein [Pseudomonadota bacterium]